MKSMCNQFTDFNLLVFAATLLPVTNLNLIYSLNLVAVMMMNPLTVRVMVMDPVTVIVMTSMVTVMVMMMVTMVTMLATMVIDSVMNLVTAVMVMDLMG